MPILVWFFRMKLFFKFKLTDTSDPFRGLFSYTPHGGSVSCSLTFTYLCSCSRKICEVHTLGSRWRSRYPTIFWLFLGVTVILIVTSKITTLLSHQGSGGYLTNPTLRKSLTRRNSRSPWIPIAPDRHEPEDERRFVVTFPPKYKARLPLERSTRHSTDLIWKRERSSFWETIREKQVDGLEREGETYALYESHFGTTRPIHIRWESRSGLAGQVLWWHYRRLAIDFILLLTGVSMP